jgi:Lantibiotic biosynthesis dehydratase C-term
MKHGGAEPWIEVNIPARSSPDVDLLRHVVDPLVHQEFADEIETWHFFFEPELRLRMRWQGGSDYTALEARLGGILDQWRDEGRLDSWATANHGRIGERHTGEAREYGAEVWDLIQRDWEIGSELALRLLCLNESGSLTGEITSTLEEHWNRHVHLYTNRIFGFPGHAPWAAEILLCLSQAHGYLLRATDQLPRYEGYETLTHAYVQMEKHVGDALREWENRAQAEA